MKKSILSSILLVVLLGCAQITQKKSYENNSTTTTTKTNPDQIEIFAEDPDRPFAVIGAIDGRGALFSGDADLIKTIRNAASEMGADAVILGGKTKKDYDWTPLSGGGYASRKATAIRWTAPAGVKRSTESNSSPTSTPPGALPTPQPLP